MGICEYLNGNECLGACALFKWDWAPKVQIWRGGGFTALRGVAGLQILIIMYKNTALFYNINVHNILAFLRYIQTYYTQK